MYSTHVPTTATLAATGAAIPLRGPRRGHPHALDPLLPLLGLWSSVWGFWCHLPAHATPRGCSLRVVFPVPAKTRADGCTQTCSKSATAAGESAHITASGSSRSVGLAAQCHSPPHWLPGTLGAQPSSHGHPLLMVSSICPLADVKAGPRAAGPRGPASTAMGQPGAEGESVFSKILPGGAAEQAGKLTEGEGCTRGWGGVLLHQCSVGHLGGGHSAPAVWDLGRWGPGRLRHADISPVFPTAVSAFGKKFTSFW